MAKPFYKFSSDSAFCRNLKRNGVCQVTFLKGKVAEIIGKYFNGKLSGEGKVTFRDKSFLIGYFKLGILHGFVRHFDSKGRLRFLGSHRHGHSVGICWRIIQGGGCVVGQVDGEGHLSGHDICYLYPDFRWVIHTVSCGELIKITSSLYLTYCTYCELG